MVTLAVWLATHNTPVVVVHHASRFACLRREP